MAKCRCSTCLSRNTAALGGDDVCCYACGATGPAYNGPIEVVYEPVLEPQPPRVTEPDPEPSLRIPDPEPAPAPEPARKRRIFRGSKA